MKDVLKEALQRSRNKLWTLLVGPLSGVFAGLHFKNLWLGFCIFFIICFVVCVYDLTVVWVKYFFQPSSLILPTTHSQSRSNKRDYVAAGSIFSALIIAIILTGLMAYREQNKGSLSIVSDKPTTLSKIDPPVSATPLKTSTRSNSITSSPSESPVLDLNSAEEYLENLKKKNQAGKLKSDSEQHEKNEEALRNSSRTFNYIIKTFKDLLNNLAQDNGDVVDSDFKEMPSELPNSSTNTPFENFAVGDIQFRHFSSWRFEITGFPGENNSCHMIITLSNDMQTGISAHFVYQPNVDLALKSEINQNKEDSVTDTCDTKDIPASVTRMLNILIVKTRKAVPFELSDSVLNSKHITIPETPH